MSHFSLCAVIPGDQIDEINREAVEAALEAIMAPYCEDTEISRNGTFHDQTDEATIGAVHQYLNIKKASENLLVQTTEMKKSPVIKCLSIFGAERCSVMLYRG